MKLLRPQYSLRWFFVEMTLAAIAVGCFAYFYRTPNLYQPEHVFLPFFGFFLSAGAAVGGVVHWPIVGGLSGIAIAGCLWPGLMRNLA